MDLPFPARLLLALAASLGLALALFALFYLTELALELWERLLQASLIFQLAYATALILLAGGGSWVVWRLLKAPHRAPRSGSAHTLSLPTETGLKTRMEQVESTGTDVSMAQEELSILHERRRTDQAYIALFGEISTGKSSLIKALLPECEVAIDPRAGTTRQLCHYTWQCPTGEQLILTDLPGLNEAGGGLDELSREEAQRAHIVVYVVDGDLTRDQYAELQQLLALEKPVILALSKMDRYSHEDLAAVRRRLLERVGDGRDIEVVAVSAGGKQEVIRVHPDGREELVIRDVPMRIEPLREALLARIGRDPTDLERRRDTAVLRLAARKLDATLAQHRHKRAEEIVRQYTHKAIFGALAAVSPGTDVIIQGYLGVGLVRSLCELYEVPAREVNVTRFLELTTKNVGRTLPLTLAVSGNALKAFPGAGTVAGGLIHAVGYGLIFESLGRAVAKSLESRGDLIDAATLRLFEENMNDDLEGRARRLAQLAFTQGRRQKP